MPSVTSEPRPGAPGAAPGPTPDTGTLPGDGPARSSALVVDDDPSLRLIMRHTLARRGYRVREADNGRAAVHAIHDQGWPDIVVTDIMMPGMTGDAMAHALWAERPELPVVFVSGYAPDTLLLAAAHGHRTALLPKPFRPAELVAAVLGLLEARGVTA